MYTSSNLGYGLILIPSVLYCSAPSENKVWHCTFCPWMCADKRNNSVIIFWQSCSGPDPCPCSFCVHSVIFHGSAALTVDEELHFKFMFGNTNSICQNFRRCLRDEYKMLSHVQYSAQLHIEEKQQEFLLFLFLFWFSIPRANNSFSFFVCFRTSTDARTPCFSSKPCVSLRVSTSCKTLHWRQSKSSSSHSWQQDWVYCLPVSLNLDINVLVSIYSVNITYLTFLLFFGACLCRFCKLQCDKTKTWGKTFTLNHLIFNEISTNSSEKICCCRGKACGGCREKNDDQSRKKRV